MSREERIAENEVWYRSLNERKAEWLKGGLPAAGFRCECWRSDCGERIQLSNREWEEARSRANRFAVLPGHIATDVEETDVEEVVEEYPHFWLIEKRGEAGDVAAKWE
jgi:ketosteroid isomerase-like protein